METVVKKWGNSLGVRIPVNLAKQLNLSDGSFVDVINENNKIVIFPSNVKTLTDKLALITPENRHAEFENSGLSGKEVW